MEVYGLLASGYGDWPIIKQIAWLLGQVMNGIFNVLSKIGIENIGVCTEAVDGASVWLTGCAGVGAAALLLSGLRKPRT